MRFHNKGLFRWTLRGKPYLFLALGGVLLLILVLGGVVILRNEMSSYGPCDCLCGLPQVLPQH